MLLIVSQLRGYGRAVCKTFLDLLLTLVCGPLLAFQILAVEIFAAKPSISPNHFLRFKPPSEFHEHPEVAREAQSRREKPGVDWGRGSFAKQIDGRSGTFLDFRTWT